MRFAQIAAFQLIQPVHIKQREARFLDGTQITAAAFHREDTHRLSGERIRQSDFGTGVASAEVCNAQIGAQQIGTIAQERQLIGLQGGCFFVVPKIGQMSYFGCLWHIFTFQA